MTQPVAVTKDVNFERWGFTVDHDQTIQQNLIGTANGVLSEVWDTLDAEFETSGIGKGYVLLSSDVEETFAYFSMKDMVAEAIVEITTDYLEQFRAERVDETRGNLRALREHFADAVKMIDAAIEDPLRFTEPPNTSQNHYNSEEKINYLRSLIGG